MSGIEILLIVSMVFNIIFFIVLIYVNESWYKTLCEQNESWSNFYTKLLNSKDYALKNKGE